MKKFRNISIKNLNENGFITESTSKRWGLMPNPNSKREMFLRIRRWFWLCIPIAGIIPFVMDSEELTDEYGYSPWC